MHEEILTNTLDRLNAEKKLYDHINTYKYRFLVNSAYRLRDRNKIIQYYKKYRQTGTFALKLFAKYLMLKFRLKKLLGRCSYE
jgi:hypothetical protein